jgi:hypothetical protein
MAGSLGKKATQSSTDQKKEGPTAQLSRTLLLHLTHRTGSSSSAPDAQNRQFFFCT